MHALATSFYEPGKVTFYNVVLFIHIAAAVAAFGGTFGYGLVDAIMRRPGQARHVPFWHRVQGELGMKLITPGAIVLLAAGIYMASAGNFDWSDSFVGIGLALLLILLGLGHGFFLPHERRAAELAERDIAAAGGSGDVTFSPEYEAVAKRLMIVGILANLMILAAVFVMVVKPGV